MERTKEKIKVIIINRNIRLVIEHLNILKKKEHIKVINVRKHHYEIVKNLNNEHFQENLRSRIIHILGVIGMPKDRLGYQYIVSAIFYLNKTGKTRHLKVENIYEELSLIYDGINVHSIEKSIRKVIESTFNHGHKDELSKVFRSSISLETGTVSNKKFIYTLAEKIS